MPQQQEATAQELTAGGGTGGFNTTTGFNTGATCTASGTYRCSSRYLDSILAIAAGEIFPADVLGKKTTWYALSTSLSSNKDGSFTSVKVEAGTV